MSDYYLTRLRPSIRKVDEDTIEVERFENGSIRWVLWLCFAIMIFLFIKSWWDQDRAWESVRLWLDSEQFWYEDYISKKQDGWPSVRGITAEEHRWDMLNFDNDTVGNSNIHRYRWIGGMNFVLLVVFSFYLAFLIRLRPVRFNRKYGVAYTYNWWGFFITDVEPEGEDLDFEMRVLGGNRAAARFDSGLTRWGMLVLHLRSRRFPGWKRPWALGAYPALYEGQNEDIKQAILDFVWNPTRPSWVDELDRQPPLRTWRRLNQIVFNFTLRPLFWPRRKTERLIKRHLERRASA